MAKKPQQRLFLVKTENFQNKEERNFYQKMLKAYLKGHTHFQYGFHDVKNASGIAIRQPRYFIVEQQYPVINKA